MAFSIRSARVEEKARAYAAQHGTTLTGALDRALDKANEQEAIERDRAFEEWIKPIREIQAAYAKLPKTGLTEDEIMGWDENGLPT
jgi:antitoxin VapB